MIGIAQSDKKENDFRFLRASVVKNCFSVVNQK